MGHHLSTHQRLEIVGMFYDLKGLNIGNKFKRVAEMAKVKGIVISEVSVRSIMAKWLATSKKFNPKKVIPNIYSNFLRKVGTKYCQIVSFDNRVKRYIFCCLCKIFKENYDDVIDIDECSVVIR